ncbi:hypothetical protein D3C72_1229040 [compost metagenome]
MFLITISETGLTNIKAIAKDKIKATSPKATLTRPFLNPIKIFPNNTTNKITSNIIPILFSPL